MNKLNKLLLLSSLAASSVSFAESSNFYVEGSWGQTTYDVEDDLDRDFRNAFRDEFGVEWNNPVDMDESDNTFGLTAGYQFNPYFGVELSYIDLGEISGHLNLDELIPGGFGISTDSNIEASASTLNAGVVGFLPLSPKFTLLGKVGLSFWEAETKYSYEVVDDFTGFVFEEEQGKTDEDGTDLYYGIGARYNINEQMYVGTDYTVFDLDETSVDRLAVNVGFKF